MMRYGFTCLIIAATVTGCTARLSVHKVPDGENGDDVKGFRYYLSRPYVVVQDKILISEQISINKKYDELANYNGKVELITAGGQVTELNLAEAEKIRHWAQDKSAIQQVSHVTQDASLPAQLGALDTSTLGTVPSGVGTHVDLPTSQPKQLTGTAPLSGRIKVVFLPDFDEKYAIQSRNCLTKNAYALNFRNGWELTDVSAEADSTTVSIELLNAIDKAIGAAQSIAEADIDRRKAIADEAKKSTQDTARFDKNSSKAFQTITRLYIKPGVYRINKPWEIQGGLNAGSGCGLLANMGLTLVQITEVQVLPAPDVDINHLGKPQRGEVK